MSKMIQDGGRCMKGGLLATDEIPERGITVITIVEHSYIVTAIEQCSGPAESDRPIIPVKIAIIEGLRTTADPRLQHDVAVRDARAGLFSDGSVDRPSGLLATFFPI
jgi:hypothetical protein